MAEELPSLHIDTDWKKQAQEEKRKLAEQAAAKKEAAAATPMMSAVPDPRGAAPAGAAAAPRRGRAAGEAPQASFTSLVQSIMTQVLYYLGEMAVRGGEPMINFDMAKFQLDTLGVLEEKTAKNLNADEQKLLDTALYECRMRYVNVVSQYIS
jgi:hypothetical protein